MASLLLAVIYMAFISLGLPDSLLGSAWPTMSQDLNVPAFLLNRSSDLGASGILGGRHFRGDFHVYHRLGVALGPYDVEIRRGQSHCSFRGADRNGLGRLLRRPELLGVVADCHTIRSWRRRR